MTDQQIEHAISIYGEIKAYRRILESIIGHEEDIKLSIKGIAGFIEVPPSLRKCIVSYFAEKLAIDEEELKSL